MVNDIKINLLPWREWQRTIHKIKFLSYWLGSLAITLLLSVFSHYLLDFEIAQQRSSNTVFVQQLLLINGQIKLSKALSKLKSNKNSLITLKLEMKPR